MNRHHSISIPEAILHSKPAAPAVVTARRSHRESCSGARDQIRCPEQVLGQEPRRAAGGVCAEEPPSSPAGEAGPATHSLATDR